MDLGLSLPPTLPLQAPRGGPRCPPLNFCFSLCTYQVYLTILCALAWLGLVTHIFLNLRARYPAGWELWSRWGRGDLGERLGSESPRP